MKFGNSKVLTRSFLASLAVAAALSAPCWAINLAATAVSTNNSMLLTTAVAPAATNTAVYTAAPVASSTLLINKISTPVLNKAGSSTAVPVTGDAIKPIDGSTTLQ